MERYPSPTAGACSTTASAATTSTPPRTFPPLRVLLVEGHEPSGPFGAKSVSEININGPLPALANAFCHATGRRLYDAPFTPERVLAALEGPG